MTGSPNLLTTIFAFLLVLGPLVLIHELGHYLVARLFGVKADAFSIGFGKELAGWTDKRGTRWKLSALPLGGYVQFAGDMNPSSAPSPANDGLTPDERARTFHVKPLWQRALIVLAGPATNFLLCVAIVGAFYWAYGRPVDELEIADFTPNSPAMSAGLERGDRIVAIDGDRVDNERAVYDRVVYFPGKTISVAVRRDERTVVLPVRLGSEEQRDEFGGKAKVGVFGVDFDVPVIGGFSSDSMAQRAGLREGDRIVAIDDTEVRSFHQTRDLVQPFPGRVITLTVRRHGDALVLPVTIGSGAVTGDDGKVRKVGQLGISTGFGHFEPVGPAEALGLGVSRSFAIMGTMTTGLRQIFTGERSVRELGGPIKIAQYSGQQFSLGWQEFVGFVAMISINLAFINLLPIPGLDGGHLAFYAAEMVRRRPLGVRSQEWAIRTGVALVLALMLFVTVNDLVSLPIFRGAIFGG